MLQVPKKYWRSRHPFDLALNTRISNGQAQKKAPYLEPPVKFSDNYYFTGKLTPTFKPQALLWILDSSLEISTKPRP
jgi:hypothetical protein